MRPLILLLLASTWTAATAQQHPRDVEIHDPDTKAWWHTTEDLSNDSMEGRDTGSPAYQRAADYVANRFRQAGLKPAGFNGTYSQPIPMHQVQVEPAGTSFSVVRKDGSTAQLQFLQQITVTAAAGLPALDAPLSFRGFCGKDAMTGVTGHVVLCFGTQRTGLPTAAERTANARAAGALAIVNIDDPGFTIEPPRWPYAYARTVTDSPPTEHLPGHVATPPFPVMRLRADVLATVIDGSGQNAAALLEAGGARQPLASFEIPAKLRMKTTESERDLSSSNVLAVLPGSDPQLANEYVAISAHLDGYGFGTPVAGDNLYNGTLDDAAYVALLIQFAEDLKAQHRTLKRSILFCVFTGEEKGLLGSKAFVRFPTIPLAQIVADINLDQLRPLFPLKILTEEGLSSSTLGPLSRQVAGSLGIEIRPDSEPERNLAHRADNSPFLEAGVPAIGFIFGYDPGTDAERRYREWYTVRYHRPQDDLTQPVDFDAARAFDTFFYKLVEAVASTPTRPTLTAKAD